MENINKKLALVFLFVAFGLMVPGQSFAMENSTDLNLQLFEAIEKNNLKMVKLLIEKKVEIINVNDSNGKSPLYCASKTDNLDIVEYLVKNGADLTTEDKKQWTALHYAVRNGNLKMAKLLLRAKGADVNATDTDGKTALHYAVINDNLEMVKLLLKKAKGVDVSATDTNGRTALHYAVINDNLDIVKYLVKAWEKVNKNKKENEKVNLIGIQDKKGKTALSLARKNSYYDGIAHYLVFKKTDETDTYSELETLDRPTGYSVCSWLQTIAAGVLGFVLSNNHYRAQSKILYGALGTTIGLGLLAPLFREKFSYINMFKKNGIKTGKILLKNNWFPVGCFLAAGLANKLFCKSKF